MNTVSTTNYDVGLRNFFLSTFNNMAAGLAVSAATAWLVSSNTALMNALFGSWLAWIVILLPLAMVLVISFAINRMSPVIARAWFYAYAIAMGVSLSTVFVTYTDGSIVNAFASSAAMFGAMSLYGYTTKRDLTSLGSFLFMGLLGLIVASVINIWLASSALTFAISLIGIVVFCGLTAFDVQMLKQQYDTLIGEEREKAGILGALSLYINFINIFLSMLNLFGNRE